MAEATKKDDEVTLKLTAEEAATALYVIGCVSGDVRTSRRAHTRAIYRALRDAGVRDLWAEGYDYALFEDGKPEMVFLDHSLNA